jgi:hypothetical protein
VTRIDEAVYPAASWLLGHGLWYDTDLHQDLNGDGVELLMAYALDLDPNLNLAGSLPVAELTASTLRISYHHTSPGITYTAETSTDLQNWTTSGVNFADFLDVRYAKIPLVATRRFLRLTVED